MLVTSLKSFKGERSWNVLIFVLTYHDLNLLGDLDIQNSEIWHTCIILKVIYHSYVISSTFIYQNLTNTSRKSKLQKHVRSNLHKSRFPLKNSHAIPNLSPPNITSCLLQRNLIRSFDARRISRKSIVTPSLFFGKKEERGKKNTIGVTWSRR